MGNMYVPIMMSWGTCICLSWCYGERVFSYRDVMGNVYLPIVMSWGTCTYLSWCHGERVFTYRNVMGNVYLPIVKSCGTCICPATAAGRAWADTLTFPTAEWRCVGDHKYAGPTVSVLSHWLHRQSGFSKSARQSSALNQNRTRDPCSARHSSRNVFQKSAGSLCTETL